MTCWEEHFSDSDECDCHDPYCVHTENALRKRIETLELELETLRANCMRAMELKDTELKEEKRQREHERIENYKFQISVELPENKRPGPYNYVDVEISDIGHADRNVILTPNVPLVPISYVELKDKEIEELRGIINSYPCPLCDIGDFRASCTCKEKEQ